MQEPAPYPVLNSITNNPAHGDERNFVQVRKISDNASGFTDLLAVEVGDELEVYVYVANDAADNLQGPLATIYGLCASFYSVDLKDPEALAVYVKLSGRNARDVWDSANLQSNEPIELEIVSSSAIMRTNQAEFKVEGSELVNPKCALLGSSEANGEMPVGNINGQYTGAGYLTFRVSVRRPGLL